MKLALGGEIHALKIAVTITFVPYTISRIK